MLAFLITTATLKVAALSIDSVIRVSSIDASNIGVGSIRSLAIGANGRILVADAREARIWILSNAGKVLDSLGRKGQGPGEFARLDRVGWRGDTIWAADQEQGRVTLFVPQDRGWRLSIVTVRDPPRTPAEGSVRSRLMPIGLLADGQILESTPPNPINLEYHASQGFALISRSMDGRLRRTIDVLNLAHMILHERFQNGDVVLAEPWANYDMWSVSANGKFLVVLRRPTPPRRQTGTYSVRVFRADGDVLWARTYPYRAQPLSSSLVGDWSDSLAQILSARTPQLRSALASELAQHAFKPTFVPAVQRVMAGDDGSVWLQLSSDPGSSWRILFNGEPVSRALRLPSDFTPMLAERSSLVGVRTRADGTQSIEYYKVVQ